MGWFFNFYIVFGLRTRKLSSHPSRSLLDPRFAFAWHVSDMSSENEPGVQQRPGRVKAPQITIWLPKLKSEL